MRNKRFIDRPYRTTPPKEREVTKVKEKKYHCEVCFSSGSIKVGAIYLCNTHYLEAQPDITKVINKLKETPDAGILDTPV